MHTRPLELRNELRCLETEVIDVTPILGHRGIEITSWLEKNPRARYLAIDDNVDEILQYLSEEQVVFVEDGFYQHGFTQRHFIIACELIRFPKK